MTFKRSVRRGGGLALLAGVALVTAMAVPASAHGSGTTTSGHSNVTGNATPNPLAPLCLQAPRTTIVLDSTGTFNGQSSVFHRATFTASEDYYFGPDGTFSDSSCTIPYAVPGTLDVGGASGADCEPVSATYQRVDTQYKIVTTAQTLCTVGVGQNTFSDTANLTYAGTQLACGVANCGEGVNSVEFTGTYTQT